MKKNKKGFTLIELLAVIVILAIIALIVTVTIGNIIDKSKKETYKNSIRNIIKAGEHYVSQYIIDNNKDMTYPVVFTCDGNECSNGTSKLQVSGKVPRSGKIILESSKNIRVEYLYNGSYCASGIKESIQVAKTCTDIDITMPTIAGTLNRKVLSLTLTDLESGIGSYCVTTINDFNSCEWINTTSTNINHTLNASGTYYAFARDKKLNVSESISFVTGDIEEPSTPNVGELGAVSGSDTTGHIATAASGSSDESGEVTYKYLVTNDSTMPDRYDERFTTSLDFERSCGTSYYGWAVAEDESGNRSEVYSLGNTSDGAYEYSEWTECSKICGGGVSTRTNSCALVTEELEVTCNTNPCEPLTVFQASFSNDGNTISYSVTSRNADYVTTARPLIDVSRWYGEGQSYYGSMNLTINFGPYSSATVTFKTLFGWGSDQYVKFAGTRYTGNGSKTVTGTGTQNFLMEAGGKGGSWYGQSAIGITKIVLNP